MAFSKEYYQFLLSFIGFGLSGAFIYAPCTAVAAHWFYRRRGTALAVMTCGSGVGGIIYPIMLARLLDRMSYRDTILIIAGFNLALMLPSVFFLKARLPPRHPPPLSALKKPWRDSRYVFLVAGAAAFGINLLSPYFNALNLAKSNNVPDHITKYTVAITQSGSVVGRICTGIISDYVGVWNVFGSVGFVSAAIMFALWTPPNIGTAPTLVGLVAWGMLSGAWFTLVGSATAHISPLSETGMRFGMLISALAIPSFVGPIICGGE
jgi:MFS family permease